MSDESLRKTYQFKLKPTPEQERQLAGILWQCRRLYNTALEQRFTLYRQRGYVSRGVWALVIPLGCLWLW